MSFPPWGLSQCSWQEIIILSSLLCSFLSQIWIGLHPLLEFHVHLCSSLNVRSWKAGMVLALVLTPLGGFARHLWNDIHFMFVMLNWTTESIFQHWCLHHCQRLTKQKIHYIPFCLNFLWVCFFLKALLLCQFLSSSCLKWVVNMDQQRYMHKEGSKETKQ